MKLPLIPQDKANHIIYGAMVYYVLQFFFPPILSLLGVTIVAASKEIYDVVSKKGTPDLYDFVMTIVGAIPFFLLKLLSC